MNAFDKLVVDMSADELKSNIAAFATMCEAISNYQFTYYSALVKSGFTPQQATEIVKEHGINPGKIGNKTT